MTPEKQLSVISKAWGRQKGYCFFPWISGVSEDKSDRIQSYREGPAFLWPSDKPKILEHMKEHQADDLYWCPSLFETPNRRLDQAMDEHALWADLDSINPSEIKDYPPTVAWETSPDRFQALWLVQGDIQGASWPGRENQCLTYYVGADVGGWDTTQLLRIPGWANHKPEYRQRYGEAPVGRLLWSNGRIYLPDEFNDLPDVPGVAVINEVLEEEINRIDRHEVWARVRLKVSKRVRELVGSREATGDRSDALWEIERELADAGCTIAEIVSVVKESVWNKFAGRADELKRLSTEASKAVAARSEQVKKTIEQEAEVKPSVSNLFELVRNIPPPRWLVKNILTQGSCGFVAGQPKSFKSWTSFDLALSIATGTPFLGHFDVVNPGPVLYIQEEDAASMVKQRLEKIYPAKLQDRVTTQSGELIWSPALRDNGDNPPIDAYIGNGFVISNPSWQSWLDDTMARGGYRMVLLDPLMMIAGDVEENRAQEMTEKIFKPMKQLSRKHDCCMVVVHHMKKGDPRVQQRGGQLMLGSVANHAWGEDSMYLKIGRGGDIIVEQESKHANVKGFRITHLRNQKWEPQVIQDTEEEEKEPDGVYGQVRKATKTKSLPKIVESLASLGPGFHTTASVALASGIKSNTAFKQLQRQETEGLIKRQGSTWAMI